MKMYIQGPAPGDELVLPGFEVTRADYKDGPYTQIAWTIEIASIDDLLKLAALAQGIILKAPQASMPDDNLRQSIPTIFLYEMAW